MYRLLTLVPTLLVITTGCAASKAAMPSMMPIAFEAQPEVPKAPLENDYFGRDRSAISEEALKEILAAPVFLEDGARMGVVPVAQGYAPDEAVPVEAAPSVLVDALTSSNLFELASEVSTEWPTDRGLPGLRELAARYRTEYLLLYRHRFNDVVHANAWAAGYATLIGALFIPGSEVDTAGVLEATLYDVKSGTILFTVLERVRGHEATAAVSVSGTLQDLHESLVKKGAKSLADQVVSRCRQLAASRPKALKPNQPTLSRAEVPVTTVDTVELSPSP